jgi:hypothetical protein
MEESKEQKIGMLLDYARECYKKGYKPTKRGIRKKFHLEIYNYFKNIADYQEKAGIPVSLKNYPKEKVRIILINYVKQETKRNHFPLFKEMERKFKIHFTTYFKNLKELYKHSGIEYSLAEKSMKEKILAPHTYSIDTIDNQKELIVKFIQNKVVGGIYPSVGYIQKRLNLSFYNLYGDIFEAYKFQ